MIRLKRAYDKSSANDGPRFLVDRLWPRGLKKSELRIKEWLKDIAPSNELRKWSHHDPAKWKEFQRRYFSELNKKPEAWKPLAQAAREEDITLVFGARDLEHNNAVVLKDFLEKRGGAG
jgi:uncharacterized protein YeaO (DUF488 family)